MAGGVALAATGFVVTVMVVAMVGAPARAVPPNPADEPTPCWSDQVAVSASTVDGAVGHRAVMLVFALAGGAEPCTLTGYPGVDTGGAGLLLHAEPTPRGYLGGLPAGVDELPTATLSISARAQAVVEGKVLDDNGNPCPSYTSLLVYPPDISEVYTVAVAIDACSLQVHPITPAA